VVRLEAVDSDPDARVIEITPVGSAWSRRWGALQAAAAEWSKD
jgi:hypothetical protein